MSYVSSEMIAKATVPYLSLSKLLQYTVTGWAHVVDPPFISYMNKRNGLTIEQVSFL